MVPGNISFMSKTVWERNLTTFIVYVKVDILYELMRVPNITNLGLLVKLE